MGAVVLVVAVVFIVTAFRSTSVGDTTGYPVAVEFDDASGLAAGTDVRMAGVKIGTVASQGLDPVSYFAKVELHIDNGIDLPTDTSARIIPQGLLGGNFVALEPGAEEEMIAKDGSGSIQYAQGAINVVDLLGRFIFSAADAASSSSGSGSEEPNFQ